MWLFLGTEVLLFAGIFVGYFVFRTYFPEAFEQAGRHLSLFWGTANTLVLLTSSLTVANAHYFAERGKNRQAFWLLLVSVVMGGMFLCIKGIEYHEKFVEYALPDGHGKASQREFVNTRSLRPSPSRSTARGRSRLTSWLICTRSSWIWMLG